MFRIVLPAALLLAAPSFAEDTNLCSIRGDDSACTRVLACVGNQGRWFHGRAFGRDEGAVSGVTNDGITCQGRWIERGPRGYGEADVECSDGATLSAQFTYQDTRTGTATGSGTTNRGEKVAIWSGRNVLGYLEATTGKPLGTLPCGDGGQLLSQSRPTDPIFKG